MPPSSGNTTFRWLRSGREAFASMIESIDGAQRSVRLEMYIFQESPLGLQFRDALVRAAERGLKVQVMNDAVGSFGLSSSFWDPLSKAGGEFRWFNPLKFGRMTYRDHRKILVCDENDGFVGGFNIAPEYDGDGVTAGWRDLGMKIRGQLARELAEAFDASFARADFAYKPLLRLRRTDFKSASATGSWSLLLGGPGRGYNYMKRTLAGDLAEAKDVQIICAYFLPTWRLRRELLGVCQRGGRVRLILAGKSDIRVSKLATQRLYKMLLKKGVEIYEYQPQVLHAKLFIIGKHAYVGSSNLDARSLNINYEVLVRVSEPDVVAGGMEIFEEVLKHCRRIDPATWRSSRSLWTKIMEDWAYFLLARVDPYLARKRLGNIQ